MNQSHERRQFGRRAVAKAAYIVGADGRRLGATVVDISDGGALINGVSAGELDQEFYLEIPGDDFVVKCRVVREDPRGLGVQFIKSPRRISWLAK